MFLTALFSVKTHRYFGQNPHLLRSKPTVFSDHVVGLPFLERDELFPIPLDGKPDTAEIGHTVPKRAVEFGRMGPRESVDDVLFGFGKPGKDVGGSRTPVAVISLSSGVILVLHPPSGLPCPVCNLALLQGKK